MLENANTDKRVMDLFQRLTADELFTLEKLNHRCLGIAWRTLCQDVYVRCKEKYTFSEVAALLYEIDQRLF